MDTIFHIENLCRHINLVRSATELLGKQLVREGQIDFGRLLIANGYQHDVSKFFGIEWDFLHNGSDVDKENLKLTVKQHILTNAHHPEYWGGFANMPDLYIAEMVCDWYARSQEFGTSINVWITSTAIQKYNIDVNSREYGLVKKYISILTQNTFVKLE